MKTTLLLSALIVSLGCAHSGLEYATTRMGREHPAKPEGCPIAWLNLTMEEIMAGHETIGMVQVIGPSGTSELSEGQRARVEFEACKLGGEAVTLSLGGHATTGRAAASYWVLAPKPAAREAAPLESTIAPE